MDELFDTMLKLSTTDMRSFRMGQETYDQLRTLGFFSEHLLFNHMPIVIEYKLELGKVMAKGVPIDTKEWHGVFGSAR